jgi:hypothetical protein
MPEMGPFKSVIPFVDFGRENLQLFFHQLFFSQIFLNFLLFFKKQAPYVYVLWRDSI